MIPKGRILYFNEELHKYTDDLENPYISTTTIIGNYYEKFDKKSRDIATACERIGKNPNHPKYNHYKGKSAKQLLQEWADTTKTACEKGTKKHNYLEDAVKSANGYKVNAKGFINDRIYTVDDIIKGHNYGVLSLDHFRRCGIDQKYPTIFHIIKDMVQSGFKIYAEIGVYDTTYLVSGLIDILLVRGKEFMILDWKTNKAPIKFEAGYFEKDQWGRLMLDVFRGQDKYFFSPLQHLADSVGNHYTLQLSTYDYLVESFGFKNIGNILCHIRTIENSDPLAEEVEEVSFLPIQYFKSDVQAMLNDYASKNVSNKRLFL